MQKTYQLKQLGGLYKLYPLIGLLFLIPALSLAGIPPLSGFWAKFTVVKAGIDLGEYSIVTVSLVVGLLTLFSMTKIWNEVFWKDKPDQEPIVEEQSLSQKILLFLPIILLALITLTIGLNLEPFFEIAQKASSQLLNQSEYINAVLGKTI